MNTPLYLKNAFKMAFFFGIIFLQTSKNFAQTQNRTAQQDEKLYIQIAQEVCNCTEKKQLKADMIKYENRLKVDSCIAVSVLKHREELQVSQAISPILTPESSQNLSNIYGTPAIVFLIKNCDSFAKSLYQNMWLESSERGLTYKKEVEIPKEENKIEEKMEEARPDSSEYYYANPDSMTTSYEDEIPRLLIKGKIEKMETKNYTFLLIKSEEGREERFIWLRNFGYDVAEDLARNFKKYKGKSVVIEYGETEVFDAKSKKFVNYREIYGVVWE